MTEYGRTPPVTGSSTAPPDPRVIKALGGHHTLPSALADLVDNSVDASARHVLIRFLTRGAHAVGLMVVDDGRGMSPDQLDSAMTYGGRRQYAAGDLGHFGVGMKAASLSQTDEMHVFTRRDGYTPAGRGLNGEQLSGSHGPQVISFDVSDVANRLDDARASFPVTTGTIVHWVRPKGFSRAPDEAEARQWLARNQEDVRRRLGLIFHRLIADGRLNILMDEFDLEIGESGIPSSIDPLDPFAQGSGAPGYPQELNGSIDGKPFRMTVAVWPHTRSAAPEFVLDTRDGTEKQGFYIYRNDRLLQAGGWNEMFEITPERRYARACLEMTPDLHVHLRMNSEKQGIVFTEHFASALLQTRSPSTGTAFRDFMATASGVAKDSKKRRRRQELLVRPEGGVHPTVYEAMEENFGFDPSQPGMDVAWEILPRDQVFDIDMDGRSLRLNLIYREELTGRSGAVSPANSPFVTTLLYLFARNEFKRVNEGAMWLETQRKWQNILLAAVEAQEESDRRRTGQHGGHP